MILNNDCLFMIMNMLCGKISSSQHGLFTAEIMTATQKYDLKWYIQDYYSLITVLFFERKAVE